MHEHHAIHELDLVPPASSEHVLEISSGESAGLFADHMFARLGRRQDPFLTEGGRQRNINRVNVRGGNQFRVTAERARFDREGHLRLAGVNKAGG